MEGLATLSSMNAWVVRGLGMALIHIVLRSLLGIAITQWPLQGSSLRMITLVLVILAAMLWGWFDAVRDRKKNPDPDHGADLTMRWLKASILGGLLAGLGTWLVNLVPNVNATQNPLFFELTSGAAFSVLLIFVPTMAAVAITRLLLNRTSSGSDGDNEENHDRTRTAVPAAGVGATDSGLGSEVHSLDQQHHDEQYAAQEYTGQDYTGANYDPGDPDADTTVFDSVPASYREDTYREDTSDLDTDADAQTPDDTSGFTDPKDVRRTE